ncbi:hypothetical protein NPX13_g2161 [Xylaria arbuscula]|uniref:C2H2-type domain-containing protein n=1 Tax=Xylaria arbuscula TaxID=114810 RepID=A0A9W8NKQ7_9PEZI|nr:hypothetical protein NPX13_g2161 [Xylaria arbuscula]
MSAISVQHVGMGPEVPDLPPEATPTVEQLEQFIPVILQAMKPASGNKVVSVGTVLGSLGFIKDGWAVFQYEDFKLDKHDDKRLAAFLETLVLENKLTGSYVKERKRKFVGTNVIQLMVQRLLRDALSNGTPSGGGGTLEWLRPDRSVICKSSDGNGRPYYMNLAKPATSCQANNQPAKVANDAGHDIRRGPARQIACNPRTKLDPSDGTRRPLGHSFGALYSGTTAQYVGAPGDDTGDGGTEGYIESPGHDTWRPGVLTGLPVNGKHHIDFVSPPPPKKRVKSDKVAQECERQNLDPHVTKNRLHTSRALREVCTDEWRADARDELAKPLEPEARLIAHKDAQPSLNDGISTGDGDANDLSELDIADLSSGQLLLDESDKIISSLGAGNIETLPDVLSNQIRNTKSLESFTLDIIDADPNEFATFFSTINVYKWPISIDGLPPWTREGESRAPATRFMYPCTNKACTKEFDYLRIRDAHSQKCDADKRS